MNRRMISAGVALLTLVSGLCLAGLRAIDRRLAHANNGKYKKRKMHNSKFKE